MIAVLLIGPPVIAFVVLLVFSHYGVSDEEVEEKRLTGEKSP